MPSTQAHRKQFTEVRFHELSGPMQPWLQCHTPSPLHSNTGARHCCHADAAPQKSLGFPGGSVVKNVPANAGDAGSIPGSGRSPGEGNGNPLQYSCLRNPMDRGTWQATVHGVTKESDKAQQVNDSRRDSTSLLTGFGSTPLATAPQQAVAKALQPGSLSSPRAFCMVSPPSHHLVNAINQNPIAENACISRTHLLLWQQFRHLSRCQAISAEINSIVFTVTVLSVLDLIHGKIQPFSLFKRVRESSKERESDLWVSYPVLSELKPIFFSPFF